MARASLGSDAYSTRRGKYRPASYPGSTEWLSRDERFLPQAESGGNAGEGTYNFAYPSNVEPCALVTVKCNWASSKSPLHWTIEFPMADAAYPGTHRGSANHSFSSIDCIWKTPFFLNSGRFWKRLTRKVAGLEPVSGLALWR